MINEHPMRSLPGATNRRLARMLLAILGSSILLAGCGGSGSDNGSGSDTSSGNNQAAATGGATDISDRLNDFLEASSTGVLLRTPDSFTTNATKLVPATLTRNDIYSPTQMYVDPPQCPNAGTDGWTTDDGFLAYCDEPDVPNDPFLNAVVGAVVGENVSDFTVGVYYPTDSNFADKRCWWNGSDYECASDDGTTGPGAQDGKGCHSGDQTDAPSPDGVKLVSDPTCQCNADLSGNNWNDWIDHWLEYAANSNGADSANTWFTGNNPSIPFYEPGGEQGKAPMFALDLASCWLSSPDDLAGLQNALWRNRAQWFNGTVPQAPDSEQNFSNTDGMKYYWGWNEVPVKNEIDTNQEAWDAIVVKLPAGVSNISDLSDSAQSKLGKDLQGFVEQNNITLGSPQTAYVMVLTESYTKGDSTNPDKWQREFTCQAHEFGGDAGGLTINYLPKSDPESDGKGACWLG